MRLGFIMVSMRQNDMLMFSYFLVYTNLSFFPLQAHCKGCPDFDFHRYMMRVLEADFKELVGIR
jgi:hypothetical protein